MKKVLLLLAIVALICLLSNSKSNDNKSSTLEEYSQVFDKVSELEQLVRMSDWDALSDAVLLEIYNTGKDLYYDYDPMGLKTKQIAACEALKERITILRNEIVTKAAQQAVNLEISPWKQDGLLFEKTETFPVYLQRGEKLRWNIIGEKPMTIRICNADSRQVLKTITGKSTIIDSMEIANPAIYYVEINPNGVQYIDVDINYIINDISHLENVRAVTKEEVECNKGDFGARSVKGVVLRKCFEEPRKFTLRGQIKAAFSGNANALVAVQVPAGATDILYSLRIATSEQDRSGDGKFHDNLTYSYNKIKFLGLPIYSRESSSGILNTILDDNRPLRDEDAYCNMYVFRNQTQAKLFQDATKPIAQLNYDVDYSTIGTQSCNGRIPVNGSKTIYLGFANERMRYANYIWVEVEAVIPATEYFTTKYSVQ